ncbi:methyl-accepting chemotaxis protein [Methylobacterium sp. Leaf111]|uniref:methyl-accepting chemotaxis protein n=1 Tax=Methylobacterium sp. Leaf111 TaxID=1736257 RepID=UPI001FCDF163|nr:methyl-accepting chemotaxis protein [Methylobacterium sp. Leaf111]
MAMFWGGDELKSKLSALDASQKSIEFDLDGIAASVGEIARRTSLLARNATIEAAPVREPGQHFAIGAAEVKSLAAQTAKATPSVESQITGTQSAARGAATAIARIGETIGPTNDIAASSTAVQQQAAVAQEMSASMQVMTVAVTEFSQNGGLIKVSTREVDASTRQGRAASRSMAA